MNNSHDPSQENTDINFDKGFTVKEVASFVDETPNVIRNWFKDLKQYIPHGKDQNGYNIYKKDGIERFIEIKKLHREQNLSMKQIEHYFFTDGESFKIEPEKSSGEILSDQLKAMEIKLNEMDHRHKEEMEKQNEYIKALIERQTQIFTQSLRESMEERKQIAVAREEEESKQQKKSLLNPLNWFRTN